MHAGEPIRVVYDVSTFGIAQMHPSARAGIYRVVQRIAQGLAASGECRVVFSVSESARLLLRAREHLDLLPALAEVPLLTPPHGIGFIDALDRRLGRLEAASRYSYMDIAVWPLLARILHWYERRIYRPGVYAAEVADIFHSSHTALPEPVPGRSAPQRFLTVYDLIPVRFPHWFEADLLRMMEAVYRSLTPADWALAISESTRNDLCEYRGMDPERVFVTPLAADPALFHPCGDEERQAAVRRRYGIPEAPYFLSLNTLEPRKNLDHAIRAFARLVEQERLADVYFVLVGSQGWKYDRILEAIAGAGSARDRIIVTGYVADEDLAALYSGALAFVYPSLYEGFGLPPLEAMQCGVPVVTSNNSSLPEVVGDAGVMVDADDLDGLCGCLLQLHRDAEIRERMRERSLARARLFSWDRCVEQTLDAYRSTLAN